MAKPRVLSEVMPDHAVPLFSRPVRKAAWKAALH
eukprot:CAMPEP_0204566036 /NCGR_PEP_ID=MMETSP0661-20131031/35824_1 /ASSEMBLY_ACC=CAM_ASM_000606 /TAXON_ID=109239 /ORGANISM="Alexandrium margalefi, Strain AMGDE01CS-322" /LENGTH=33 /DNA_ID= /DNA_START= /DNA_END= /DNA_ORIENTATION=